MAALQYVEVPGYAALIVMRSYSDLTKPNSPIPRSREWLADTGARYNASEHRWYFPSGARLDFGYLQSPGDEYNYSTAEYQFIGVDEVTLIGAEQYRFLHSRLRRLKTARVPLRMRAAGGPVGPGVEWVRERFLVDGREHGRPFIPARLEDNPHLDRESYEESLAQLDPVTRRRLREGDWTFIPTGSMFRPDWLEIVRARPEPPDAEVRAWDMAATEEKAGKDPDYTAGLRMAVKAGVYYIDRIVLMRGSPAACRAVVRQQAALDGLNCPIVMEQEPGASGKIVIDDYATRTLAGFAFKGVPATGSKTQRATPLSIAAEQGLIKLVEGPHVSDFVQQASSFGTLAGVHDDLVDAAALAFNFLREQSALTVEVV